MFVFVYLYIYIDVFRTLYSRVRWVVILGNGIGVGRFFYFVLVVIVFVRRFLGVLDSKRYFGSGFW